MIVAMMVTTVVYTVLSVDVYVPYSVNLGVVKTIAVRTADTPKQSSVDKMGRVHDLEFFG